MVLGCLLLLFGLAQSTNLLSKNLQRLVNKYAMPRDVMKVKMMTKNWTDEGLKFNKVTPTAGLFQHKQTNEIIFETKEKSWNQGEIFKNLDINDLGPTESWWRPRERNHIFEKNWDRLFFETFEMLKRKANEIMILEAVAEVINVDAINDWGDNAIGESVLIKAVEFRSKNAVEILLKRGANVNYKPGWGERAAIHYAASPKYFDIDIIKMLLEFGANIDETDWNLQTPLMYAAYGRQPKIVEFLLNKGANISLKDENKFTALCRLQGIRAGFFISNPSAEKREATLAVMKLLEDAKKSKDARKNFKKLARSLKKYAANAYENFQISCVYL